MNSTETGTEVRATPAASGRLPAALLLAATLIGQIGATWDIQWHADVGPDTFFTLPHLFIYASAALAGLTSLAVVLSTTAAQRAGRPVDPVVGGKPVGVFGSTFTAPIGYLVTGLGAASFLLYGLWDLWWHTLYGFDAVIDSPPHIGLFLSDTVTSVGVVMVFAAARAHRWGVFGALASLAVLLAANTVTAVGLQQLNGLVRWSVVGTAALVVLVLVTGAGFLGRFGGALAVAAMVAVLQAVFWWFAPWAARTYADLVGLPVRDNVDSAPVTPALIPLCLVGAAAVVDLVLRRARERPASARRTAMLAGGLGCLIVTGCAPFQSVLVYNGSLPNLSIIVSTVVAGTVLGLFCGMAGWRFGGMLALLAPATTERQAA
jgi:hypothetical protein